MTFTNEEESEEVFYCQCKSEAISVEKIKDIYGESEHTSYYLSFWERGFGPGKNRLSLKDKIKLILYILKKGVPYADMVILDEGQAERLSLFLKQENKNG